MNDFAAGTEDALKDEGAHAEVGLKEAEAPQKTVPSHQQSNPKTKMTEAEMEQRG